MASRQGVLTLPAPEAGLAAFATYTLPGEADPIRSLGRGWGARQRRADGWWDPATPQPTPARAAHTVEGDAAEPQRVARAPGDGASVEGGGGIYGGEGAGTERTPQPL